MIFGSQLVDKTEYYGCRHGGEERQCDDFSPCDDLAAPRPGALERRHRLAVWNGARHLCSITLKLRAEGLCEIRFFKRHDRRVDADRQQQNEGEQQEREDPLGRDHEMVFGIGASGTGKTYLAVAMAVDALASKDVSRSDARFTWMAEPFLLAHDVKPWTEVPLWIQRKDNEGFHTSNVNKAIAAGLTFRPLAETIRDTLAWHSRRPADHEWRNGLKPDKEQTLLAAWHARAWRRSTAPLRASAAVPFPFFAYRS